MLDGPDLINGIITLFKQFHPQSFKRYVWYMTHYYKLMVQANQGKQLPDEAGLILAFLDELIKFDGQSREFVNQALGGFTFDCYNIPVFVPNR